MYELNKTPVDQIRKGGDKWLQGMSDVHQNIVLGIDGAKAWRKGEDWRKYMRSWQGLGKADTRLRTGAVSGALNDKNDPDYSRREAHAIKYYRALRNRGIDDFVNKINRNTGVSKSRLASIYNHIFVNKHKLGNSYDYFDPSYEMAVSFQRLIDNPKEIKPCDIMLLKHEHLELAIMKKLKYNYNEAHNLAEKKYNYALEWKRWEKR
ncbi:MAG: hypothetical protein IKK97_01090 [Phascolarctobacterium sp.]|nr:hypothetical protein [Phascolarctobacterium sp.]